MVGWGLLVLVSVPASASEQNHYYKYTDEAGVLHVTNMPGKRPGDWHLWKSLAGNRTDGRSFDRVPMPDDPTKAGTERFHRYDGFVRGAGQRYRLPESLLRAVIHTESNFYPRAVSRAGATGLMQLMPATARMLGVDDPMDPAQNIFGGARYLRMLANRYDGDMVLVLAAYNAGAGNVEKYGGVPPFEETRAYVRAVLRRYYAYERRTRPESDAMPGPARHVAP